MGAARLFVRAASGRKRDHVLGALDAVTHRLIRVTNHDSINAESVCALVRVVAEASVGLPITLVLDNARYQKCARVPTLAASLGIELLYLPRDSPNLNLIERLWRFGRQESLNSTYDESSEQSTTAIEYLAGHSDPRTTRIYDRRRRKVTRNIVEPHFDLSKHHPPAGGCASSPP